MKKKKLSEFSWPAFVKKISILLDSLSFRMGSGMEISVDKGYMSWVQSANCIKKNKKTIFLIGNGASASMASHFAADLAKNARLHTQVFSDISLITAVSNDISFEKVFAEPLLRSGSRNDMLIVISSSGSSPNIIAAIKIARKLKMQIVTLTAMKPDNKIRHMGHLNIYVAANTYGLAETCHAAILHFWMDLLEIKHA